MANTPLQVVYVQGPPPGQQAGQEEDLGHSPIQSDPAPDKVEGRRFWEPIQSTESARKICAPRFSRTESDPID